MKLCPGPLARLISINTRVRLVLDGNGVDIYTIGVFHACHVVGKLAGVVYICNVISAAKIAAAIYGIRDWQRVVDIVGVLKSRRWRPGSTPNTRSTRLSHLHDGSFNCGGGIRR